MSNMSILDPLQQMPATQAKQAFGEMLHRVREKKVIAITSHGRIQAFVSSPEMWAEREARIKSENDIMERKLARAQQSQVELDRLQRHANLAVTLLTTSPEKQALLINEAKARVARWRANSLCSEDYIVRWNDLLALPVKELAKEIVGDCAGWGKALRQNTPFSLKTSEVKASYAVKA
jgi:prevent-host-death family protein